MKLFGLWFSLTIRKAPCEHRFSYNDVISMNIDPLCIHCGTPLSQFENKSFTIQEINSKLRIAGKGNQYCLDVIEALCKK